MQLALVFVLVILAGVGVFFLSKPETYNAPDIVVTDTPTTTPTKETSVVTPIESITTKDTTIDEIEDDTVDDEVDAVTTTPKTPVSSTPVPVTPTIPQTEPAPAVPAAPAVAETMYENGTYTAVGSYKSPAGKEEVTVSLTLTNDVITGATYAAHSDNDTSLRYQQKFEKKYSALVVGKKLDTLSLTVVNGASLTPKGFMNAVATIKSEALR